MMDVGDNGDELDNNPPHHYPPAPSAADHNDSSTVNFVQMLSKHINVDDYDDLFLTKISHCKHCKGIIEVCMPAMNFSPGLCLLFNCGKETERCDQWYACMTCSAFLDKRRVKNHFQSKKHKAKCNNLSNIDVEASSSALHDDYNAANDDGASSSDDYGNAGDNSDDDAFSNAMMEEEFYYQEAWNYNKSNIYGDDWNSNSSDDEDNIRASTGINAAVDVEIPKVLNRVQVPWIESAFKDRSDCDTFQVWHCLKGMPLMQFFWVAQHSDAGMQYLVARSFLRTEFLVPSGIPSREEATYHVMNFIQYTSMSEKQRNRQSILSRHFSLMLQTTRTAGGAHGGNNKPLFLYMDRVSSPQDMARYYGSTSAHSMWNTLPIPPVKNIGGIGYVSPYDIVRFVFAMGIEVDNVVVNREKPDGSYDSETSIVLDVSQCLALRRLKTGVKQNKNSSDPVSLIVWCVDWRDGFGANRAKSMRKPLVAWTWTVSPPKEKINAVDNTFAVAVGLKKSTGWNDVEHQFRKDVALFGSSSRILVYHGGLKQVVPIFVKRIASLEDKIERADVTNTMGCGSPQHRIFGVSMKFDPPSIKTAQVKQHLFLQQDAPMGNAILTRYGWSAEVMHRTSNSAVLPSCYSCRKRILSNLYSVFYSTGQAWDSQDECDVCANWTISDANRVKLRFVKPDEYPTTKKEGIPAVPAPLFRDIDPNVDYLEYIDLSFEFLKGSVRFAFYNSYGRSTVRQGIREAWTKAQCCAYLGSCGVNGKHQEQIWNLAQKAWKDGVDVDYTSEEGVGQYLFAASWNGELDLASYIETVMHLLFLGVVKSNVAQMNDFLLRNRLGGAGVTTFRRDIQELLKALSPLNMSWLLIEPFSWSVKSTYETSTWVGENWMAWVRISKITCAWFTDISMQQAGSNDLIRLVIAFQCLVARLMTHSGVSEDDILVMDSLIKEFLSCSRELDIRLRHLEINKKSKGPTQEQFWLKANFLSLLNLVRIIKQLGPLCNMWDGGGKGERYIQQIKPHVPRGVRDNGNFFICLVEKLYKLRVVELLEKWCRILSGEVADDNSVSTLGSAPSIQSDASNASPIPEQPEREEWFTAAEDEQMLKARTIHIYRNRNMIEVAVANHHPIAGAILPDKTTGNPKFFAVYKVGRKSVDWIGIEFDDLSGSNICGSWYAPLSMVETTVRPPRNVRGLKKAAKMAAVAIPLKYCVSESHPCRHKYCVLTNWWKERVQNGTYVFPRLDYSLYSEGV